MNGGANIPFMQKFVSSFVSGAIASSIGNPFDVCVRPHALRLRSRIRFAAVSPAAAALLTIGVPIFLCAAGAYAGRQHQANG